MDPGLIILLVLVGLLVIGLVTVLIVAGVQNSHHQKPAAKKSCTDTILSSTILSVHDPKVIPCKIDGTQYYYLGKANAALDFIVSAAPTDPGAVCLQFCRSHNDGVCDGDSYNGKTAQENYDQCLKTLVEDYPQCIPPAPLAADGTVNYYAWRPKQAGCGT